MKPKKILLLEDEIIIAKHIELVLKDSGYQSIRANSIEDFKNSVEVESPDLAIVDINVETKHGGICVGNWLKEKDIMPFIYLTSYTDSYTVSRAIDTNPKSYLVKPFREKELLFNVALAIKNYVYKEIESPYNRNGHISVVPYKLKKALNHIEENIGAKISLTELAEITGWSKPHFNKNFKDYLKISPYQFILERKMERAKEVVLLSNTSIIDISFSLGFSSHSNFNKAFTKFFGITANEYRKIHSIKKQSYSE